MSKRFVYTGISETICLYIVRTDYDVLSKIKKKKIAVIQFLWDRVFSL